MSTLNRPNVKRVVITSSVAAIISPKPADPKTGNAYTFTEADWNTASPKKVKEQGSKAPNSDKYGASKTLAEQAAWDFISEHQKDIKFDLVTINPPYVFGPVVHEMRDVAALNESNAIFRKALLTKQAEGEEKPLPSASAKSSSGYQGNFVDVRTIGVAHTRALQKEEAGGNRFIVSAGTFCWQDVCEYSVLSEFQFSAPIRLLFRVGGYTFTNKLLLIDDALDKSGVQGVPKGFPGSQSDKRHTFSLQDGSKAARVLGVEYPSPQKTFVNTLNSLKERFPKDF